MTRRNLLTVLLATVAGAAATRRAIVPDAPAADFPPLTKSKKEWKALLLADAYAVLFEEDTEPSHSSPLEGEHRDGTFVCAACYLPLFISDKKFESGTGWPSFFDVIKGHVATSRDYKLLLPRTEYHCARCGGHQGHVFDDGPAPTGLRYCNNGVALNFVPKGQALPELRSVIARLLAVAALVVGVAQAQPPAPATAKAIFAGGCFWCAESDFEKVPGVLTVVSGYTGGHLEHPKYEDTHDGSTGHAEAVEVTFDPAKVTYAQLVEYFWHHHDPLDGGGQFCDHGNQYRPAIFYLDADQQRIATDSRDALAKKLGKPIATEITKAGMFWPAEDYHQDYYKKNPIRYHYYRTACGRDARVEAIWKGVQ